MKPAPPVTREVVTPFEWSVGDAIRDGEIQIAGVVAEMAIEVFHYRGAGRELAAPEKAHPLDADSMKHIGVLVEGQTRVVSRRRLNDPIPPKGGPARGGVSLDRDDRRTTAIGADRSEHLPALRVPFVLADVHVPRCLIPLLLEVRDA